MQRPAVEEEMAKRGGGGEREERRQRSGVMRFPRDDDGGKTVEEPVDAHRAVGGTAIVESTTITSGPKGGRGAKGGRSHHTTHTPTDGRRRLASGTRTGGGRSRGPLELEAAPAGAPAGGALDAGAAGGASPAASLSSTGHGDA
eukprot:scaffold4799_cov115-Isochrysis_galbana.AAC.9